MTFATKLTFRSGDRDALDRVVEDVRETARRKGAELKGPHSDTPTTHFVSLYKRLDGDRSATYDDWQYTVYQRRLEIRGHDDLAREIVERDRPDSVHLEADIDRMQAVGSNA